MSYGNNSTNFNNGKSYDPSWKLRGIGLANFESTNKLRNGMLQFRLWSGLLKVSIAPWIETSDGGRFKYDNLTTLYFRPERSLEIIESIKLLINNADLDHVVICTNKGYMQINKPSKYETAGYVIEILNADRKVTGTYETAKHFYYTDFNTSTGDIVSGELAPELELYEIIKIFDEHFKAGTGANAHQILEATKEELDKFREVNGMSRSANSNSGRQYGNGLNVTAANTTYSNSIPEGFGSADIDSLFNK